MSLFYLFLAPSLVQKPNMETSINLEITCCVFPGIFLLRHHVQGQYFKQNFSSNVYE
jgi:hypothetical protein